MQINYKLKYCLVFIILTKCVFTCTPSKKIFGYIFINHYYSLRHLFNYNSTQKFYEEINYTFTSFISLILKNEKKSNINLYFYKIYIYRYINKYDLHESI